MSVCRPSLLDFLFSDPPMPAAVVVIICCYCCSCCKIQSTNNFKLDVFSLKPIFTKRHFEPTSLSLTFFPQLNVVCLLNSAHECAPPPLLDFLFSDPPLPAAVVEYYCSSIIIIVGTPNLPDPVWPLKYILSRAHYWRRDNGAAVPDGKKNI